MLPGARLDEGEQVVCRLDPVRFRLLLGCERAGALRGRSLDGVWFGNVGFSRKAGVCGRVLSRGDT